LLVEVGVPGDRLPDQHEQEQHAEGEAERVLAQKAPHRCSTPSALT
jgi:hypothetical protein